MSVEPRPFRGLCLLPRILGRMQIGAQANFCAIPFS
jgi:hypothetical protein